MNRKTLAAATAAAAALLLAVPAVAHAATPTANEVENTWLFGHVAQLNVQTPSQANPGPDPALPNASVYLIAPIDPASPFARGVVIPSPPAPAPVIVAVHDTVMPYPHGPANCYGIDVLAGPKATPQTVLTRVDPNGGATLAYALKFGPFQVNLTNPVIIELAAKAGLLTLDDSWPGYGGTCWTGS